MCGLGGAKASPDELQESRDRQDREQKLNAKYASIHKKVGLNQGPLYLPDIGPFSPKNED